MHLWIDHTRHEVQPFTVQMDLISALGLKPATNGDLGDDPCLDTEVCQSCSVWKDRHGSSDE